MIRRELPRTKWGFGPRAYRYDLFEQMLALEWLIDNVEDQPVNAVFLDAIDDDDAGRMIFGTAAAGAIYHE
jgi:hypothetical protein